MSRNCQVISLDTNILIKMYAIASGDSRDIKIMVEHGEYDAVLLLMTLIQNHKVKPIITPVVLYEVLQGVEKHGTGMLEFIKDSNIYVLELSPKQQKPFFTQSQQLAMKYCRPLSKNEHYPIIKKPKFIKAAPTLGLFESYYDKDLKRRVTNNDAMVMAQATVLGTALVTNDLKDFIAHGRPQIISYINEINGYRDESRPYSNNAFVEKLADSFRFPNVSSQYANQVKKAKNSNIEKNM